jgi:hypothetical protein
MKFKKVTSRSYFQSVGKGELSQGRDETAGVRAKCGQYYQLL